MPILLILAGSTALGCAKASNVAEDDGSEDGSGAGGGAGGGSGASSGGSGPCTPGTKSACYSGPEGTEGVGVCRPGTKVCSQDGSGYGACTGEILPADEDCNLPEDEDCDGDAPLCPGAAIWGKRFGDNST